MFRLRYFTLLALFLGCYTQIKAQDSLALEDEKYRILLKSDISLLLRDSPAVDIFTSELNGFPIRVSKVNKSAKPTMGGNNSQIYYQGELTKGIAFLYNTNMFYTRTKGKIPDESVYYYGSKSVVDTTNVRKKIEDILINQFKFKILDIEDSCNVWKIQKIDTTKLVRYDEKIHGIDFGSGPDDSGKNLSCIGFPLSYLYRAIEPKAKIIIIGDEFDDSWDNRYNFDNIPYALMTDLNALNELLEKRYGIKFIKTKMLQKLKLIEFEE